MQSAPAPKRKKGPRKRPLKRSFNELKVDGEERLRLERATVGDGADLLKSFIVDNDPVVKAVDRKPAWVDADDKRLKTVEDIRDAVGVFTKPAELRDNKSNYQKYLKKKFVDVYGEPSWSVLGRKVEDDDDPDVAVLRTGGKLLEKPTYLTKGIVEIKMMPNLNSSTKIEGPIVKTVRFHPTTSVALVSGLGSVASLFQVDGSKNNKLTSVRFERFPIRCSRFAENGNEFIVGSNLHSHFFVYDMLAGASIKIPVHRNMWMSNMKKFEVSPDGKFIAVAGRLGEIHLLTATSKEWVGTLLANGSVEALCFSPDGKYLYAYGDIGIVHVYDLSDRRLCHQFHDEGSIKGVSLTASPCGSLIAAGSSSGYVNLYETREAHAQVRPPPTKAFKNLVTSATSVCFNHSSQILGLASDEKENAVKLVHVPSMTVFSNFPSSHHQLGRVQDLSFSPHSGYLSFVNNKSTAYLFRLRHFGNY